MDILKNKKQTAWKSFIIFGVVTYVNLSSATFTYSLIWDNNKVKCDEWYFNIRIFYLRLHQSGHCGDFFLQFFSQKIKKKKNVDPEKMKKKNFFRAKNLSVKYMKVGTRHLFSYLCFLSLSKSHLLLFSNLNQILSHIGLYKKPSIWNGLW